MSDVLFAKAEKSFFDRFFAMNPLVATYMGLHDPYDRLMPDGSLPAVQESVLVLKEYLDSVTALDDGGLSPSRRIDKRLVRHAYDLARFAYEEQKVARLNPEAISEFLSVSFLMVVRDYASTEERFEALAARLWDLPVYLEQFRTRFGDTRVSLPLCEAALETVTLAPHFVTELCRQAQSLGETQGVRFNRSCQRALHALETHRNWLAELAGRSGGTGALGREKFEHLLSIRGIDMDVGEVLELGLDRLERAQIRVREILREIGMGMAMPDARVRLAEQAPATFEDVLTTIRGRIADARAFVVDEELATIPGGDRLQVEETPSFLRPFIPYAAVFPPGKFDENKSGVCVVTRPPDAETLRARFHESEITNLVNHETYPGHFLQAHVSGFGSKTRWLVQAPETVEGWAHYCEQLMLDRGFHDTVGARLAQARALAWRAARVIMDVRLTCGEWTTDQAVAFMKQEASLDEDGARAEVRRAWLTPGRPLSYLVGKTAIARLKAARRNREGARFSETAFHDTLCANGWLPFFLVEKSFELADDPMSPASRPW